MCVMKMKKLTTFVACAAMVGVFATSAFAANGVSRAQDYLNSKGIAVGVFVLGGVLFCAVVPRPLHRAARPAAQSPAPPVRRGQPHAADLYAAPAGDLRRFIGLAVLGFCIGSTAQFPPDGLSTAPAAATRHLRCQNAR